MSRPSKPEHDRPPSAQVLGRLKAHAPRESRYRLLGEIARGGMGAIIKVWDEDLRRTLAMKVALGSRGESSGGSTEQVSDAALDRFLAEAQITAQLDHPGIVPVHELSVDEAGQAFFTMRLVHGRDLEEVFRLVHQGEQGWTLARATGVLLKACEALAYAHDKRVIHRDLKPANIMVGRFGEVYVMDWGLARVLSEAHQPQGHPAPTSSAPKSIVLTDRRTGSAAGSPLLTVDGDIVGTPAYMPPEQADGDLGAMGPHSDVYSLGAILYHLLAGRPPFGGEQTTDDVRAVWQRVRQGPPPSLDTMARGAPPELVAICLKAMAREPQDRYRDMLGMAADLQAHVEGRVVRAHRTGAIVELRKWVRRNRAAACASAVAVLALIAGLVVSVVFFGVARDNERLARTSEERTKDALARSLFDQGQAVRLAGSTQQSAGALDLFRRAAELVRRERPGGPADGPAAGVDGAADATMPTLDQIRTGAVAALLSAEVKALGTIDVVRSVDGRYSRTELLSPGARFLLEVDTGQREDRGGNVAAPQLRVFDLDRNEQVLTLDRTRFAGEGPIALGPRGERFVGWHEGLHLWDLKTGGLLGTLAPPKEFTAAHGPLRGASGDRCSFSASGRYFAHLLDHGALLWDIDEGCAVRWFRAPGRFDGGWGSSYRVDFSGDGSMLAVSGGRHVAVFAIADGAVVASREFTHAIRHGAKFLPDERLVVHVDRGTWDQVQVWDPRQDIVVAEFPTEGRGGCPPAISPSGAFGAFGRLLGGAVIQRLADGVQVGQCERLNAGTQRWLRWQSDGAKLQVGHAGGVRAAWQVGLARGIRSVVCPFTPADVTETQRAIDCFAFSPDGRWLAIKENARRGEAVLVDIATGHTQRRAFELSSNQGELRFSPDSTRLVCCSPQGVRAWPVDGGPEFVVEGFRGADGVQGPGGIVSAAFDGRGRLAVLTYRHDRGQGELCLHRGARQLWSETVPMGTAAQLSLDGRFVVLRKPPGELPDIEVCDVASGKRARPFAPSPSVPRQLRALTVELASDLVVSSHADCILGWRLPTAELVWRLPIPADGGGLTSPDGRLAVTHHDQTYRLWNGQRGEPWFDLPGEHGAQLHPNGQHLAVRRAGVIDIYHLGRIAVELHALAFDAARMIDGDSTILAEPLRECGHRLATEVRELIGPRSTHATRTRALALARAAAAVAPRSAIDSDTLARALAADGQQREAQTAAARARELVDPTWIKSFGFTADALDAATADPLGVDASTSCAVASVVLGGPAAAAGMRVGDLVTRVAGQPATLANVTQAAAACALFESVPFEIRRENETRHLDVAVGCRIPGSR